MLISVNFLSHYDSESAVDDDAMEEPTNTNKSSRENYWERQMSCALVFQRLINAEDWQREHAIHN